MDGMALLYYISVTPCNVSQVLMIGGVPMPGPNVSLPIGTILVADPSVVVNNQIMIGKVVSYPVTGPGGQQTLQVAETVTPVTVDDDGTSRKA